MPNSASTPIPFAEKFKQWAMATAGLLLVTVLAALINRYLGVQPAAPPPPAPDQPVVVTLHQPGSYTLTVAPGR